MLSFYKYQGAGNDFVMIDNRAGQLPDWDEAQRVAQIARWCDRHFGIGADGLILLEEADGFDFGMRYYNADGRESSMCGNGGRCIVAFARQLGIIGQACRFVAIDGPHEARIQANGWVELQMQDVATVQQLHNGAFTLNTGSPHYIAFVPDAAAVDVAQAGSGIRYSADYREEGINVNFVSQLEAGGLQVATYERGVEAETLACGTGVTAAALAHALRTGQQGSCVTPIQAKGGALEIRFEALPGGAFEQIWLCGPAEWVFQGSML